MIEKLDDKELERMSFMCDPVALMETLIPSNLKAPHTWGLDDQGITCRPYQIAMLDYSYMYADDPELSEKANFKKKIGAGTCYNISARNVGKSFLDQCNDFFTLIHGEGDESCHSSFDFKHLKKVLTPVANLAKYHPFFEMFRRSGKDGSVRWTGGGLEVDTMLGYVLYGKNEKVDSDEPGTDYHGLHVKKMTIEEFCVDGQTQIRWVDNNGKIYSGHISTFINKGLWKNNLVYSYNFEKQKIELKKVTNIFQKQVKNYSYWDLRVESFSNRDFRKLITSQKQKIWTDGGYKEVEDLNIGDTLYTFDYIKLTDTQKEILVGTLLGDASITQKHSGKCHPSLVFVHGKNQEEYLRYKQKCFQNLFRSFHRSKHAENWNFLSTEYGGNVAHITSDTSLDFYEFLDFKKNELNKQLLQKYLSPISLAFWIMDDGSLVGNSGKTEKFKYIKLHTQGFNYKTHLILKEVLKTKFQIDAEIQEVIRWNKKYYNLFFNNKETLKLINLVRDYIHPTLYYKIYTKVELCELLYKSKKLSFHDMSTNIQDLLQPVKIISKEFILKKSWKMHDIEVEDNHNFFAGGVLISNSYASDLGKEKRIDAISTIGCIERFSGIPDVRKGSPLGDLLLDDTKKNRICRLPQMVMETWDEDSKQRAIKEYGGENSFQFKLNILAESIEGAFGRWDMRRVRKLCYNPKKKVKEFEFGRDNIAHLDSCPTFEEKTEKIYELLNKTIVIDNVPSELTIVASDVGTTGTPSQVCIFFGNKDKMKWRYLISLFRLTTQEQARVFNWIYKKLDNVVISLDCTDADGRAIADELEILGVPKDRITRNIMHGKIKVGFVYDKEGNVETEKNGEPIYKMESTIDWACSELDKIFYNGLIEVPHSELFLKEFPAYFATKIGTGFKYGSSTSDHLVQSFQCMAVCRFYNLNTDLLEQKIQSNFVGGF